MSLGIIGPERSGKSFTFEIMQRFMTTGSDSFLDDPTTKIGGEHSVHFKTGEDACTRDINVWSEPIIFHGNDGKEWALLLIDTRGFFGRETPEELATFISSFLNFQCEVIIVNALRLDFSQIQIFTNVVAMCKEDHSDMDINTQEQSVVYFLERDSRREAGVYDYFTPEKFVGSNKKYLNMLLASFKTLVYIAFPRPLEHIEEASFNDQPLKTLGDGKLYTAKMQKFCSTMKLFLNKCKDLLVDLTDQPQKSNLNTIKIYFDKASEFRENSSKAVFERMRQERSREKRMTESVVVEWKFNQKVLNENLSDDLSKIEDIVNTAVQHLRHYNSRTPIAFIEMEEQTFLQQINNEKIKVIFASCLAELERRKAQTLQEFKTKLSESLPFDEKQRIYEGFINEADHLWTPLKETYPEITSIEPLNDEQMKAVNDITQSLKRLMLIHFEGLRSAKVKEAKEKVKERSSKNLQIIRERLSQFALDVTSMTFTWKKYLVLPPSSNSSMVINPFNAAFLKKFLEETLGKANTHFFEVINQVGAEIESLQLLKAIRQEAFPEFKKEIEGIMLNFKSVLNHNLSCRLEEQSKTIIPKKAP